MVKKQSEILLKKVSTNLISPEKEKVEKEIGCYLKFAKELQKKLVERKEMVDTVIKDIEYTQYQNF